MSPVTVTGANHAVLTVSMDGVTNLQLAQQFATLVNNAAAAGTLAASVLSGTSAPPPVPAGFLGEAEIDASPLNLAWPAGYAAILDVAAGPTTISAALVTAPVSILAAAGGTTLFAGSGQTVFIAGGGSNVFNGYVAPGGMTTLPGAGSSTLNMVATGGGDDTIIAGTGNFDIDPGTGRNVVTLGAGTSYVNSLGQDLITSSTVAGAKASTIYLGGTGATVIGGTGALEIFGSKTDTPGGGSDVVTLGSGGGLVSQVADSTINLAGAATVMAAGNDTINVGGATAIVYGGPQAYPPGSTLVNGPTGTGSLRFTGGTDFSTVAGGTVAVTIAGASGGKLVFTGAASGNLLMSAGALSLDASAATGDNTFVTSPLSFIPSTTILGGTGADTFMIGTGRSTLTGGAGGANTYAFRSGATGGTQELITDFKATDKLSVTGYNTSGSAVLANATVSGGSTTITLSDQTQIILQNFTKLTSGNFS